MKKIIINADDFGYSSGVNAGIIKAHQEGILTSTTLMGNMPGAEEAVKLAKENPTLGVGIHLVLKTGKPMSRQFNLIADNGKFYPLKLYPEQRKKMLDQEIFEEWCSQIDYLLSLGLEPTHFDSHHHVHYFKENQELTLKIARKYGLNFRNSYGVEKFPKWECDSANDLLLDMMNTPAIRDMERPYQDIQKECLLELQQTLDRAEKVEVLEMMVHPAYVDEHLYQNSSFNIQRVREVKILTDPEVKDLIEANNFELVNFKTAK